MNIRIQPVRSIPQLAMSNKSPLWIAVQSRLYILTLAVISHVFGTKYDTSNHPNGNDEPFLPAFLRSFANWDGVYFLSIAKNGYVFEQQFAFFPLLPWIMSKLSVCFS